jgi:hypothetical protein
MDSTTVLEGLKSSDDYDLPAPLSEVVPLTAGVLCGVGEWAKVKVRWKVVLEVGDEEIGGSTLHPADGGDGSCADGY